MLTWREQREAHLRLISENDVSDRSFSDRRILIRFICQSSLSLFTSSLLIPPSSLSPQRTYPSKHVTVSNKTCFRHCTTAAEFPGPNELPPSVSSMSNPPFQHRNPALQSTGPEPLLVESGIKDQDNGKAFLNDAHNPSDGGPAESSL